MNNNIEIFVLKIKYKKEVDLKCGTKLAINGSNCIILFRNHISVEGKQVPIKLALIHVEWN